MLLVNQRGLSMRTTWTETAPNAIKSNGRSVSQTHDTDQTDSDGNGWFVDVARPLLAGTDAGLSLHLLTGFEERTCYRYAAGDRKPPGWFIVSLLRSEQGATWLAAFMDKSEARWWVRHLKAERIYNALAAELGTR